MSGVQPSAKDNGIVENVLGTLLGLVLFALGIGVYLYISRNDTVILVFLCGMGLFVTLAAANSTRKTIWDLKEAGVTHPVAVLRADLND